MDVLPALLGRPLGSRTVGVRVRVRVRVRIRIRIRVRVRVEQPGNVTGAMLLGHRGRPDTSTPGRSLCSAGYSPVFQREVTTLSFQEEESQVEDGRGQTVGLGSSACEVRLVWDEGAVPPDEASQKT